MEYRAAARRLSKINQQLTDLQHNTEENSLETIAVLRSKDLRSEEKVFSCIRLLKTFCIHIVKGFIYPTLEAHHLLTFNVTNP